MGEQGEHNIQHSLIAFELACHIVQSIDGGETPCGSLAEAEGMLREALPLVGEEEDLDEHKARILVSLADLIPQCNRPWQDEWHPLSVEAYRLQNAEDPEGSASADTLPRKAALEEAEREREMERRAEEEARKAAEADGPHSLPT